ncbi:MAG: hypothetical protein J2P43_01900 [Candidatus Dormibacteraeota bacterium]|nr:hypothetical protein [Candidatus Dormibacteraeota bacterium]
MAVQGAPAELAPGAHVAREIGKPGAGSRVANRAAVVALLIGGLSLFIGVLGPLAIVAGFRARRSGGGWLALLAIITGSVATGFLLLGIIHYLLAVLA